MSDNHEKPIPPETWECCGGGCSPCVWDTYYDALHDWNEKNGIKVEVAEPR